MRTAEDNEGAGLFDHWFPTNPLFFHRFQCQAQYCWRSLRPLVQTRAFGMMALRNFEVLQSFTKLDETKIASGV